MRPSPASLLVLANLAVGAGAFRASVPSNRLSAGHARATTADAAYCSTTFCSSSNTQLNAYRQAYQYQLDLMTAGEIEASIEEMDKVMEEAKVQEDEANNKAEMLEQEIATLQAEKDIAIDKLTEDIEKQKEQDLAEPTFSYQVESEVTNEAVAVNKEMTILMDAYEAREAEFESKVQDLNAQLEAERQKASEAKTLSSNASGKRTQLEKDLVEMKLQYEAEKEAHEVDNMQAKEEIEALKAQIAGMDKLKEEIATLKEKQDQGALGLLRQGVEGLAYNKQQAKNEIEKLQEEVANLKKERQDPVALLKQGFNLFTGKKSDE